MYMQHISVSDVAEGAVNYFSRSCCAAFTYYYKATQALFPLSCSLLCACSLSQEVLKFSSMLKPWLNTALKGLPDLLQEAKYKGQALLLSGRSIKYQTENYTQLHKLLSHCIHVKLCLRQIDLFFFIDQSQKGPLHSWLPQTLYSRVILSLQFLWIIISVAASSHSLLGGSKLLFDELNVCVSPMQPPSNAQPVSLVCRISFVGRNKIFIYWFHAVYIMCV